MIVAADAAHDRKERTRLYKNREAVADDGERRGDAETGEQQHHNGHCDSGDKSGEQSDKERLGSAHKFADDRVVEALVPSACLLDSALENKHRYNFCDAIRKNVAMIRAPATNVPRNVPETFEM